MTSFLVTDEQKVRFSDRIWELQRRFREGSLNPEETLIALQSIVEGGTSQAADGLLVGWQRFYREVFSLEVDLSKVVIPVVQPSGFGRLMSCAQGLTISRVLDVCRAKFPVYCYWDNPDQQIIKNDRIPDKVSYAVWARDRVEADEELKNRSASQLRDNKVPTETLLERLLHELKYERENPGQHLDTQNWTLCAGSRDDNGNVPNVNWNDGKLHVNWCNPDNNKNWGDSPRAYNYLFMRVIS